jgi:hypothetical protein
MALATALSISAYGAHIAGLLHAIGTVLTDAAAIAPG